MPKTIPDRDPAASREIWGMLMFSKQKLMSSESQVEKKSTNNFGRKTGRLKGPVNLFVSNPVIILAISPGPVADKKNEQLRGLICNCFVVKSFFFKCFVKALFFGDFCLNGT